MKIRPSRLIVASALGLGLALAPAAANAATPAPAAAVQVAKLATPVDQTSYAQQLNLYYTIAAQGKATYTMQLKALPGAKVTVTVNGRTASATANASGIASIKVTMVAGNNSVSVKQSLNGKSSDVRSFGYSY